METYSSLEFPWGDIFNLFSWVSPQGTKFRNYVREQGIIPTRIQISEFVFEASGNTLAWKAAKCVSFTPL